MAKQTQNKFREKMTNSVKQQWNKKSKQYHGWYTRPFNGLARRVAPISRANWPFLHGSRQATARIFQLNYNKSEAA